MLTAFRITFTDGFSYVTDMAAGTTLQQATEYFMQDGGQFAFERLDGSEFIRTVANVEQVK